MIFLPLTKKIGTINCTCSLWFSSLIHTNICVHLFLKNQLQITVKHLMLAIFLWKISSKSVPDIHLKNEMDRKIEEWLNVTKQG